MNSKDKGDISEAMIMAAFLRAGKVVLKPFGDNQRYDFVYEENGKFFRVQCKTARMKHEGVLTFSTCSSQSHRGKGKKGYKGEIEFFGVYSPALDKVYLISVDDVGENEASLRLVPPKNIGHTVGIRYAKDYEFGGSV